MPQKLCQLFMLTVLYIISTEAQRRCSGRCVNFRECQSAINLYLEVQAGRADLSEIRSLICGAQNGNPLFCCQDSNTPNNNNVLPSNCGHRTLQDRIIGGDDAPINAWPWAVVLEATNPEGRRLPICGGVLISDRYVLTAAHCVRDRSFTVRYVRVGEHTISQNPDCQNRVCSDPVQIIEVEELIVHEEYGQPTGCSNCNDIALIRLRQPAQLSLSVQPICLPQNFEQDLGFSPNGFSTNRLPWIVGWGNTDQVRRASQSDILQEVQIPIDPSGTACELDLRSVPNQLRNTVICAGGDGKDSCKGDSGGPMMMANIRETRHYVIGIVSRGPRICAAQGVGGVYTNVHEYIPWIRSKLRP